jgi:hypothetical protein
VDQRPTRTRVEPLLWPLPKQQVILLDTTNIMNRVAARVVRLVREPRSTSIELPTRVYASDHVMSELYRGDDWGSSSSKWDKLSQQTAAEGRRVPASRFADMFEREYLPRIVFVDMGQLFEDHRLVESVRRRRGGRGASDAPTAQLAVLLSRMNPVVFSEDSDLSKPKVAPPIAALPAVASATSAVAEHAQLTAAGALIGVGAVAGIDRGLRGFAHVLGLSPWIGRGILALGGAWMFASTDRRNAIGRAIAPAVETLAHHSEAARRADAVLAAARVDVVPHDGLEACIAEALVRASHIGDLLASTVMAGIERPSGRTKAQMMAEVRATLKNAPCFEETTRGRFALGHTYR